MSKAVLFSIKPKYCELIASGKKTMEVWKTRPKIDMPFKCYIYETKALYKPNGCNYLFKGEGKVIGEFVCKCISEWNVDPQTKGYFITSEELTATCLTYEQLHEYGNEKTLYGFHISDLVIYDNPKELSEFEKPHEYIYQSYRKQNSFFKGITRPPQSVGYVEELI